MSKLVTKLKCDSCETGIVKLVVSQRGNTISASVGKCSNCKKSFGMKSIQGLEQIKDE